jgi:hypothetical protein
MAEAAAKPQPRPAASTRRLLDAAAEIIGVPDPTAAGHAFIARPLVQTTLPHSESGQRNMLARKGFA